jgi:FKBP-type peptidyl-prolyl cis-trans isomerase SlyD
MRAYHRRFAHRGHALKIIRNSVVALKYEVFDARGELVDRGKSPYYYLHGGYQGIFPRVEEALGGKDVGEKVRVRLAPADAFGERPTLVRVDRAPVRREAQVGMQVRGRARKTRSPDGVPS